MDPHTPKKWPFEAIYKILNIFSDYVGSKKEGGVKDYSLDRAFVLFRLLGTHSGTRTGGLKNLTEMNKECCLNTKQYTKMRWEMLRVRIKCCSKGVRRHLLQYDLQFIIAWLINTIHCALLISTQLLCDSMRTQ